MRALVELNDHALRAQLYELFKEPVFHLRHGETLQQERVRTMLRWKRVAELGFFKDTIASGTPAGRAKYEAVIESAGLLDHSLDIKMSVHYGLFGATIALMGNEDQVRRWAPKVETAASPSPSLVTAVMLVASPLVLTMTQHRRLLFYTRRTKKRKSIGLEARSSRRAGPPPLPSYTLGVIARVFTRSSSAFATRMAPL
jgi:Acyl-CoA dehydrogenase, N-terminal domain